MGEDVLREFARFRRRHVWVRAFDLFLEAAFVMTVTAAAMLLIDRLAFELGFSAPHLSQRAMVVTTLLVPLALSAVFAFAALQIRPVPPARVAWQLDRATGAEERFLSALEFAASGDRGVFVPALFRDALRTARDTHPSVVLPRIPVGYRWGIVLSLAVGGLLWAYPPQLYEAPEADLDAFPVRGPAPLEVFFRDGSIGAIDDFLWEFGDGQTGSGERAVHVYERPGIYTAKLSLRGPGGGSTKACTIEVLPADRASADFRGKPLKGRGTLEVSFENLSRNAKRLTWDFGDGAHSSETSPVHVYKEPGLYSVRLVIENDLGKDEKIRDKYVKVAHPDEPIANFRAMRREGEAPLEVYFEDLSSGMLQDWSWDFGDLRSGKERLSSERNPTHVYKTPGYYTVRLRVIGPHGEDEEEKIRYIHVTDGGNGGGGGGQRNQKPTANPKPQPPKPKGGPGIGDGNLLGDESAQSKAAPIPVELQHHHPGSQLEKKDVVYTDKPSKNGDAAAQQVPLEQVLPQFQRAAEDAIERELIPPAYRDHVLRYYEDLNRK
jgi:PKD repeat protein